MILVGDQFPDLYSRFIHVPTLLWFGYPWDDMDQLLDGIALAGAGVALLVLVTGAANMMALVTLWALYFSLVSVGQTWFSFGWESQLLETGFLAIWCVPVYSWKKLPRDLPPPRVYFTTLNILLEWIFQVCVWGFRWLIFRIMLGAGLIKIRGDECWRDLTCMNYFYQTQPVPNPIAYYAHQVNNFSNNIVRCTAQFIFRPRLVGISLKLSVIML